MARLRYAYFNEDGTERNLNETLYNIYNQQGDKRYEFQMDKDYSIRTTFTYNDKHYDRTTFISTITDPNVTLGSGMYLLTY
eukprot:7051595-Pyramimonas_sp.AAC.1